MQRGQSEIKEKFSKMCVQREQQILHVSYSLCNLYRSSVELHSTALPTVPGAMSISNRHIIYGAFCRFSLHFVYLFEPTKLESFCTINLNQNFGVNKNNLD
jgi:hypothetical protein